MIEILPMTDREQEKERLAQVPDATESTRVLAMTERGETLGWAAVDLTDGGLTIRKLAVEGYDASRKPQGEEVFILDSLMRSAASYGETFGANQIETSFPDFFDFFRARGFDVDEIHAFTPMSTIVHYHFPGQRL